MTKARKNEGNRGFIKEIESPKTYQDPIGKIAPPKQFKYAKPIVPKSVQSEAMNTPRRLSQHMAAAPGKSTLCQEQQKHIENRQRKK